MTPAASDTERLLASLHALIPDLQAATAATDRDRRVPPAIVERLRAAGAYRLLVPLALGGEQADLQTWLRALELIAQGDSAAGWDVATNSFHTRQALTLPADGVALLYAAGPDVTFAGGDAGSGRAVATDGGYRVTGTWRFASGSAEAAWMHATNCQVFDGDTPRRDASGRPEVRRAFLPRREVPIADSWRVMGLRGTGSHDWCLTDAFVPSALTQVAGTPMPWPGTLYRLPLAVFAGVQFSAVATGIARRAIDSLVELAATKTAARGGGLLRERVQVKEAVARAEALLESARAYRTALVADAWAAAEAGEDVRLAQRARLRLAGVYATENAVRAVDLMFQAGRTTSIEDASPLSHCFRDVHAVAQNFGLLPEWYEDVGTVLLSGEPSPGRF